MKLEELSRYGVLTPPPSLPPRLPRGTELRTGLEEAPGSVVASHYGAEHRHGFHALRQVAGLSPNPFALVCRDPELAHLDFARTVFLDTETTGLGTGAGTYVFLVGAGYLEDGGFQVRQFFLRGPHREPALLEDLADFFDRFSAVVTFNGKTFDVPLLQNRFILHHRRPPFDTGLHVDLLHPARRLWKRRLESCALSSLEAHVLGVRRTGEDVPGYLIPQLYFQYLATGDGRLLDRVLYHNLHDVLSLASLGIHVGRTVADPHCGLVEHGVDYLSLARVYEAVGETDTALECYEEAVRRLPLGPDRQECLVLMARAQKRERRWEAVLHTWYQLADEGGAGALLARVELAKYFEHVERDYMQAMDHVQHALALTDRYGATVIDASRRDLDRRLSRLLNRAIRDRSWVRRL
jgi:uncharacterized protein YprB with RNaseH-like and TPR domain